MTNLVNTLPSSFLKQLPQELLDDEEALQFEALEVILEEGIPVFRRYSGSGGVEAEIELIYQWEERYWYTSMTEELAGPYDSLDVALEARGGLIVEEGTQEIECEEWSVPTLLNKLVVHAPAGHRVEVNGQRFQVTDAQTLTPETSP